MDVGLLSLTLSAAPAGDVAGVIVGQDLTRGRQGSQLDVGVQGSLGGQTEQSDVIPGIKRKDSRFITVNPTQLILRTCHAISTGSLICFHARVC